MAQARNGQVSAALQSTSKDGKTNNGSYAHALKLEGGMLDAIISAPDAASFSDWPGTITVAPDDDSNRNIKGARLVYTDGDRSVQVGYNDDGELVAGARSEAEYNTSTWIASKGETPADVAKKWLSENAVDFAVDVAFNAPSNIQLNGGNFHDGPNGPAASIELWDHIADNDFTLVYDYGTQQVSGHIYGIPDAQLDPESLDAILEDILPNHPRTVPHELGTQFTPAEGFERLRTIALEDKHLGEDQRTILS